jgi:B12-binding domain/radical SAM domain protein
MNPRKMTLVFRRTAGNRFSIPVLLNAMERNGLDTRFNFKITDNLIFFKDLNFNSRLLIVYSFMTAHIPEVFKEIQFLKGYGKSLFIAGGPHATGDPEGTMRMGFDHVFTGPGESAFPDFCRKYAETGCNREIPPIIRGSPHPLNDSFPFSSIDPFIAPLEITRGCANGCRFCQTRTSRPEHRSKESISNYLDELVKRGKLFRTGFICPSGFEYGTGPGTRPDPERLGNLLESAKSMGIRFLEYGIFPSEVRPNTVRAEFLAVVKAHCSNRKITIGAQSGSERILKTVCRNHSVHDIERAAAMVREAGFKPHLDFILGFPGENEEDRMETIAFMKRLTRKYKAWNQIHYFLPLSGTPLYRSQPSPLSQRCVLELERLAAGGISNDWWKKGVVQSRKIVEALGKQDRSQFADFRTASGL